MRELFYILAIIFLGIGFLFPDHFSPWTSFYNEALAFLTTIIISTLNKEKIKSYKLAFIIMMIPIYSTLQKIFGLNIFNGDIFLLYLYCLACIPCLLYGENLKEKDHHIMIICVVFIFIGLASTIITWIQSSENYFNSFLIFKTPNPNRPDSNIAQANHLGNLINISFACCIFLFNKNLITKNFYLFACLTLGTCLALSLSRSAILGFLILTIISYKYAKNKIIIQAGIFVFLIYLMWPLFKNFISNTNAEREIAHPFTSGSSLRLQVWPDFISAALEKPFFGHGFNNISAVHSEILKNHPQNLPTFTYSHNIAIDFSIWFGIPFTLLFSFFFVNLFLKNKINTPQNLLFSSIILIVLNHSMFEYPYTYSYFLFPLMVSLGYIENSITQKNTKNPSKYTHKIITTLIALGCLIVWRDYSIFKEKLLESKLKAEKTSGEILILDNLDIAIKAELIKSSGIKNANDFEIIRRSADYHPWNNHK